MRALRRWLRYSKHVHIRQGSVASTAELVHLVDRFLDRKLLYPLEWDDFISWEHADPEVEYARRRLAQTEPLFFSKKKGDLREGMAVVLRERNRLAASAGLAMRESGSGE